MNVPSLARSLVTGMTPVLDYCLLKSIFMLPAPEEIQAPLTSCAMRVPT